MFHAERVSDAYHWKFKTKASSNIEAYNEQHRNGLGMNWVESNNWLDEASRTCQLFPAHPFVWPCIDFGREKRSENLKTCRKTYRKSDAHSPGIFTVQCVCRYPKLVGVSVMDECEGVSTALSVLLSRFKMLPNVCYYDNGCTMLESVVLHLPWVND